MLPSLFEMTPDTLAARLLEAGMARYVADQVLDWAYAKAVIDPDAMTNLSARNRAALRECIAFTTGEVVVSQEASDGTCKLLLGWPSRKPGLPVLDGSVDPRTECVMIPTEGRHTACVSSQIGCPVGCRFCASGIGGLDGNLGAGQIVEQVFRLRELTGSARRISNVVFMGMGEPLANYAAVTRAIRIINAPWGLGVGARKITVSTVGMPAAIRRLVDFDIPVTLALSLHAPNDELRRQLIPWSAYATIDELLDACDAYFAKTGREITLEYLLLRHVNDRPQHARELTVIARRLRANVNLIRYNEVRGLPYDRPRTEDVRAFQEILRRGRVNAHIRASRGRDIAAACGQLRHEESPGAAPSAGLPSS